MKRRPFNDMRRVLYTLGAFVLLSGATAAFAQTPAPSDKKSAAPPAMQSMAPGGVDMRGSMSGMMKGMESMSMSGDTDRDFAMMMKIHHQGAIDMAQMELASGKDPKMRALAKRIIAAQQKEIKEIDQWLGRAK